MLCLKKLGVDVIWLMLIYFIGEENCKGSLGSFYLVKDYWKVNFEFGILDDFKVFVNKVYDMGMYVILDWVVNYSVWDNWFRYEYFDWYDRDY